MEPISTGYLSEGDRCGGFVVRDEHRRDDVGSRLGGHLLLPLHQENWKFAFSA